MAGTPRPRGKRSVGPGFSLIELLLAVALGSMLVVGLAGSAQVFGEQVEHVEAQSDLGLEEALVAITDAARTAWLVERVSATRLELTDALGGVTAYYQDGDSLMVRRPSGATGEVLGGVSSLSFGVARTRRYVEASPSFAYGDLFSSSAPAGEPAPLTLHNGEALAIGFRVPLAAPAAANTLDEVHEQLLDATLDGAVLALSFFDGSRKEFCHLHATGPPHDSSHPSSAALLAVDLHEARLAGDPRPYGAALATASVQTAALPQVTYKWINIPTAASVIPPEVIDPPNGVAWGWWADHPQVQLVVDAPPAVDVSVDLASMARSVQPGKAYALVLRVSGVDYVNVPAYAIASAEGSNVAFRAAGATAFTPLAVEIPVTVQGMRRCTRTTAHDVVSRVTVTIATPSGTLSASAGVASQTAASHAWAGPVPGSSPAVLLAGH